MFWSASVELNLDLIRFVCITVMAGKSKIVFVTAAALCHRYDMVELDLVVSQMNGAVLASIIVSSDHPHFCSEWNISS